jgi:hypothetical protein
MSKIVVDLKIFGEEGVIAVYEGEDEDVDEVFAEDEETLVLDEEQIENFYDQLSDNERSAFDLLQETESRTRAVAFTLAEKLRRGLGVNYYLRSGNLKEH